jgi:Fe-S-cluster-containing dehydrogenase component
VRGNNNVKPAERWRVVGGKGMTGAGKETDCIRCMTCEVICSFTKEGRVNLEASRIKVEPNEIAWMQGKTDRIVVLRICEQCPGIAPCMRACPIDDAIMRDDKWGTVLINHEKCILCVECVNACPSEALWFDETNKMILKCDLCSGSPRCVEWCPVKVLRFLNTKQDVEYE